MSVNRSFFRQGYKRGSLDKIVELLYNEESYGNHIDVEGKLYSDGIQLSNDNVVATEFLIEERTEQLKTKDVTYPYAKEVS